MVTQTVPCGHVRSSYGQSMSKQYLILIEQLVREGRSEHEIDRIVRQAVAEDVEQRSERADGSDDTEPAHLLAA